jgi:two-component system nitrate/nitrite response regulator NarL
LTVLNHLFLSEKGDLMPRWHQAFPVASAARISSLAGLFTPDLIWLRLRPDLPTTPQLLAARQQIGSQPYIVLSDVPSDEEALSVFSAGARGYCNSHASAEVLQQVAAVVSQGGLWVGESLMQRLVSRSAEVVTPPNGARDLATVLTQRELEVARTVVTGASNKEIARQLGITERTVKSHVGAIFEKLQVRDRLQLAMLIRDQDSPS